MNKTLRNTGLAVLAAGALVYPAILLYRYVAKRRNAPAEQGTENTHKNLLSAWRGNHKPHRRKAEANGHLTH
jgi:hypothetical protein